MAAPPASQPQSLSQSVCKKPEPSAWVIIMVQAPGTHNYAVAITFSYRPRFL